MKSLIGTIDNLEDQVIHLRKELPKLEGLVKDRFLNPEKPLGSEDVMEAVTLAEPGLKRSEKECDAIINDLDAI